MAKWFGAHYNQEVSVFLLLNRSGGVESAAFSTLNRYTEKIRQKFVIYGSFHIYLALFHNVTYPFHFLNRWMV